MIDLHSHILPGIDDGPGSLAEACEVARAMVEEGITAVTATPHVREDYPTTADQMERGVVELRTELARLGIELDVLPGGEIDLERLPHIGEEELRRFTLAQTGRYVLIEFPYFGWPLALEGEIHTLRRAGITPILAHPERNPDVQEEPTRLEAAVSSGALVQVTAASLDGREGRAAKRAAKRLCGLGLVHLLASDVHGRGIRDGGFRVAAEAVGDRRLARYLLDEVPAAVAAGDSVELPPPRFRRWRSFQTGVASR